jgi:hypothetical protein
MAEEDNTAASSNTASMASNDMVELEKKWGHEGLDLTKATKEDRDLYLKLRLWQYGEYNLQDLDLWEQYRDDFTGWAIKHFQGANGRTTRNLRTTLRTRGVWVGRNQGRTLPEALYDVLQEEQEIREERYLKLSLTFYKKSNLHSVQKKRSQIISRITENSSRER